MERVSIRDCKPRVSACRWTAVLGLLIWLAGAAQAVTLGVIGDSYGDEYAIKSSRNRHRNFVEQLAAADRVSFGNASGNPTQYQYNFAFSGATTDDAVSSQLPSTLSNLASLDYVVISIGINNFAGWTGSPNVPQTYRDIYNGNAIVTSNTVNNVVGDIQQMIGDIRAQNPNQSIVLANVPDWGAAIGFRSNIIDGNFNFTGISDPAKRQLVTDAVSNVNSQLTSFANGLGIPVVDNFGLLNLALQSPLYFPDLDGPGPNVNVTSNPSTSGQGDGTYFWADAIHAGTLYHGLFANAVLTAINMAYGEHLIPLLPQQIATAYTGSTELSVGDLQILGDNWQQNGADWAHGDFNGDGLVNLSDLQIIGDNWNLYGADLQALDIDLAGYVITPEPAAAMMLLGGMLLLTSRRR
ncbi:MAG: hypothetical protein IT445_16650 [Phycisphaeraceae bacterium]|nr:hypothetical protein [Phycisphaeraceae bacterium]